MDTNRDSAHQSQNEDNFATFSLGLEFLNEAEKEKNNGNFAHNFTYREQSLLTDDIAVRFWCTIPPAML